MLVTTVTVYVKPGYIDDFIRETLENHENSVQEPGNLRFDFLQSREDPSRFLLYEAYESDDAAARHKETHYKKWRDAVGPWMAKSREGIPHRVIAPADRGMWR
jgi:autoinducer 2-degrading protein